MTRGRGGWLPEGRAALGAGAGDVAGEVVGAGVAGSAGLGRVWQAGDVGADGEDECGVGVEEGVEPDGLFAEGPPYEVDEWVGDGEDEESPGGGDGEAEPGSAVAGDLPPDDDDVDGEDEHRLWAR